MEEKFSIFIPLEIEKSNKTGEERYDNMKFKGIASNPNKGRDKQGQWLDTTGFDFSDFVKSGQINYHHLWKDKPLTIIGEPTKASLTKNNEFYIEGTLYKDSPIARDVYDLAEILQKNSKTRRLGFSIEGVPVQVDPLDKNRITKARITNVAITPSPVCPGTALELMKGGLDDLKFDNKDQELLIDITENGIRYTVDSNLEIIKSVVDDEIEKGGIGSGRKRIKINSPMASHSNLHGKTFDVHKESEHEFSSGKKKYYHIKDEKGNEHEIKEDFAEVQKAIVAGSITGTETTNQTLTGEPLKPESVEGSQGKKKKKAKIKNLISKGEAFTMLIQDHNLDATSCKRVWFLASEIQKSLSGQIHV